MYITIWGKKRYKLSFEEMRMFHSARDSSYWAIWTEPEKQNIYSVQPLNRYVLKNYIKFKI